MKGKSHLWWDMVTGTWIPYIWIIGYALVFMRKWNEIMNKEGTSDSTRIFSQRLVNDHADACSHVVDPIMYFNIV